MDEARTKIRDVQLTRLLDSRNQRAVQSRAEWENQRDERQEEFDRLHPGLATHPQRSKVIRLLAGSRSQRRLAERMLRAHRRAEGRGR